MGVNRNQIDRDSLSKNRCYYPIFHVRVFRGLSYKMTTECTEKTEKDAEEKKNRTQLNPQSDLVS